MKKSQFLIAALCASVLVLGACRSSRGEGDGSSSGSTSGAYGTSETGTSQGGTSQGGTSQAGTSQGGTSQTGTSQAGTSGGGVSGSTAGTSGTSGSGEKTDWSAEDLQVIDYYLGVDIPYMYVEGAELHRDTTYACVSYGGSEEVASSKELLKEYASLFDESWNIRATRGYEIDYAGFMYFGSKTVGEGENAYDISVQIYGYDEEEGVTADGSGMFYADFSDGYYYSWAEFSPTYHAVLDNIYGDAFPDAIDYPADSSLFYIDVYSAQDTALVFAMWGVGATETQAGFDSFIELFEASENWESYSNAIEGCPAYYDASKKVAVGYLDYGNAAMVIVEPYEEILPTWPSTEISTFIASVNDQTEVVVPALSSSAYVVESDEDAFSVYAFDDQLTALKVEEYAQSFPAASWTVEEIEDPDIGFFWSITSKDFAVNVQAAYIEQGGSGYAVVIIIPSEPLAKEFSVEAVQTFYSGLEEPIAVPAFEAYSLANANGGFEVYANETSYDVYVLGSSTSELATFVSSFVGSTGWALDEDRSTEDKTVYADPDSLAMLKIIDKSAEVGAHYIQLSFGLALDWSDELKAQFEETLHGVVPPYFAVDVQFYSDEDGDFFYFVADDDEGNFNADFAAAYVAFESDSSWTADDYYYEWTKDTEDGGYADAYYSNGYFYIVYMAAAEPGWSEDDLDLLNSALGGIIPEYFDGGYDATMAYYLGVIMSANEFSYAEFAEYADASGWEEVAEPLEAVIYEKWAEDQSGVASFFLDMFGYIEFEYTQVAWKASEITAFESELHGIVPSFLRLGLYEIGGEEHAFVGMSLFETAEELVEALDEDLAEQAWVKSGSGAETVYTLASEDGEGYAQIAVYYDDYFEGYSWVIDFVANAA